MVSSEMEELMGMCDRILVMAHNRITAEFHKGEYDQEKIIVAAIWRGMGSEQPAGIHLYNRKRASAKDFFINYGLYAVFAALIGFFSIKNPAFLTLKNGITILQMASTLGVVVVGMFFVLITAGIDISVASNMYFSAVVACTLLNTFKIPIWMCFVVSMLSGCLIGSINGLFVAKFKMSLITTLATSSIARGFGLPVSRNKLIVLDQSAFVSNTRILGVPLVLYLCSHGDYRARDSETNDVWQATVCFVQQSAGSKEDRYQR